LFHCGFESFYRREAIKEKIPISSVRFFFKKRFAIAKPILKRVLKHLTQHLATVVVGEHIFKAFPFEMVGRFSSDPRHLGKDFQFFDRGLSLGCLDPILPSLFSLFP